MKVTDMGETNKKNNKILISDNACSVILAFLGCVGCVGIMAGKTISYTNSCFAVIIFALSLYAFKNVVPEFRQSGMRNKVYAYIFGGLISVALHMGAALEVYDSVNFKSVELYLCSVCLAIYLAPFIHALWNKLFQSRALKKNDEKPLNFFSVWLMIFVLWIPTFMAFFPGAFVYDATDEYVEVISRQFTMHHPLIHVLLLGGLVHLGEYIGVGANAGIAIYTIFQMAAMSWIIAYVVTALQKMGVGRKWLLGTVVFTGVFPLFPMYAVCSAKDTLFTGAFAMIVILLIQFAKDSAEFFDKKIFLFVAASTMMMLLRNNGAYAYMAAIILLIPCFIWSGIDRKHWTKILIMMVLSVVLYKGTSYCLKLATHATDFENQEMLTVPIQQITRVYTYAPEAFTEEEKEVLYEVLPESHLKTYNPRCSDVLKSGFNNSAYNQNPGRYRKLWGTIGARRPLIYLNAWLVNSYGYWYPDMIINVYKGNQMRTFQYRDSSYFGFETEVPGERHSLFPLLETLYRNISLELFQQKVPVISMLFSPGFAFYVFAAYFVGLMREKRYKYLAAYIPVLLLWGTVLLGPTILVRYVLILWFIIPLMGVDSSN